MYDTPEQVVGRLNFDTPWQSSFTICNQWSGRLNDEMKSLKQYLDILSKATGPVQHMVVDLGTDYSIAAFSYTPQRKNAEDMMQSGKLSISQDGTHCEDAGSFEFGN